MMTGIPSHFDLTPNQKGNMEQRIEDLIAELQKFDKDTRIVGVVEVKWNDKRTAVEVLVNDN